MTALIDYPVVPANNGEKSLTFSLHVAMVGCI
ncbi:hypothetical protein NOVOSPHI9U_290039 [Novosphingobium sp. 9U]|nr:hypothetical protein NOVOSPHI9U_290039 [Novosphingobium sp. 9U]